jgi:2-methylcitrate dehydratase
MTQVEALAKYAARASFADLSAQSRQQLPVHILDSLGCCIAALGAGPVEACRTQVADFGGDGPCALIGGGKANPLRSVLAHRAGALRRLHGQLPGADRDLPYSR